MSVEDPTGQFNDLLMQTAESTILKTCLSSKQYLKIPWFDGNWKKAIKERFFQNLC